MGRQTAFVKSLVAALGDGPVTGQTYHFVCFCRGFLLLWPHCGKWFAPAHSSLFLPPNAPIGPVPGDDWRRHPWQEGSFPVWGEWACLPSPPRFHVWRSGNKVEVCRCWSQLLLRADERFLELVPDDESLLWYRDAPENCPFTMPTLLPLECTDACFFSAPRGSGVRVAQKALNEPWVEPSRGCQLGQGREREMLRTRHWAEMASTPASF